MDAIEKENVATDLNLNNVTSIISQKLSDPLSHEIVKKVDNTDDDRFI